jgi:hypothetical protein
MKSQIPRTKFREPGSKNQVPGRRLWDLGISSWFLELGIWNLLLQLRDITGIEEHGHVSARPWWPYALGIAAALLMSLFLAGWKYYRRNPEKAELPPGPWAFAQVERIEALLRSSNFADMERYAALLCEVIRLYLEKRFQLRAPRQTTTEFFHDIKDSKLLTAAHQELLKDFLERCDLSKFAHLQFSQEEYRALGQAAQRFVEETAE